MSEDRPSRRDFLRRAAATSAISVAALGAGLALDDCSQRSPTSTTTSTSTAPQRLPPLGRRRRETGRPSPRHSLAPSFDRRVRRTRPRVLLYNEKFVGLHPQGVAYCASSEDVARCVDFATSHQMAMCARSGGHSYAGYSSCDGLVIDVSRLNGVRVDTAYEYRSDWRGRPSHRRLQRSGRQQSSAAGRLVSHRGHRGTRPRRGHRRVRDDATDSRRTTFAHSRSSRPTAPWYKQMTATTPTCSGPVVGVEVETSES